MEPATLNLRRIADRYQYVLERIGRAAHRVGRNPGDVRLVVVTKGHSPETIREVAEAGAQVVGENYVEEALTKQAALTGLSGVEWHMIGHVQSRKADLVSEHFDYLHSLDSLKLATRLDRFAGQAGCVLKVLLECNISGEANKHGFSAWDETRWTVLQAEIEPLLGLTNLRVRGLMTMAPFLPNPEDARPYFQHLRRLQEFLAQRYPRGEWAELSMGMSADYEVAVQEGATWVRVGTAIVGPRIKR